MTGERWDVFDTKEMRVESSYHSAGGTKNDRDECWRASIRANTLNTEENCADRFVVKLAPLPIGRADAVVGAAATEPVGQAPSSPEPVQGGTVAVFDMTPDNIAADYLAHPEHWPVERIHSLDQGLRDDIRDAIAKRKASPVA